MASACMCYVVLALQWLLPTTSVSLWCYVFYVSKYYELLDTLFLLLKNKKPRLVQVLSCPRRSSVKTCLNETILSCTV